MHSLYADSAQKLRCRADLVLYTTVPDAFATRCKSSSATRPAQKMPLSAKYCVAKSPMASRLSTIWAPLSTHFASLSYMMFHSASTMDWYCAGSSNLISAFSFSLFSSSSMFSKSILGSAVTCKHQTECKLHDNIQQQGMYAHGAITGCKSCTPCHPLTSPHCSTDVIVSQHVTTKCSSQLQIFPDKWSIRSVWHMQHVTLE